MGTNHPHWKTGVTAIGLIATAVLVGGADDVMFAQRQRPRRDQAAQGGAPAPSVVLGRPTEHSIAISLLMPSGGEAFVEYGTKAGDFSTRGSSVAVRPGEPEELTVDGLQPATRYQYRVRERRTGEAEFAVGQACCVRAPRARDGPGRG
jgi:hypothetical protein